MLKRIIVILFSVVLLAGCLPSPITDTHKNSFQKSMISRSLVNIGNTERINSKIKYAKKGEKLLVAFVGTFAFVEDENGQSVADTAVSQIKNLLGKKADVELLNFSVYGMTSEFGNIMLNREVLSKKPDVIFLDYAIFDGHEQSDRENFEAIIRSCIQQENNPQVVLFLSSKSDGSPKQDFMEQIAKYYNLPIISSSVAFLPEYSSGRMKADEIYSDKLKYTDTGKQYIADFCTNYFAKVQKVRADKEYIIPPSMYPNLSVQNPKFVDAADIQAENDGSYIRAENKNNKLFKSRIEYLTNADNIPFIFIVEADNVYIVAPVSKNRKDVFEILINGKKTKEFETYAENEEDMPQVFKVYSAQNPEKVAVAVQIKEQKQEENAENPDNPDNPQEENQTVQDNPEVNPVKYKDFEFWGIAYTNNKLRGQK